MTDWIVTIKVRPDREMTRETVQEITYYSLRHLWEKTELISVKVIGHE